MSAAMELEGHVALVTGSARGIGEATAGLLAARGARVVVADRRADEGEAVARRLDRARPGSAIFVTLDVGQDASWAAAIASAEAAFGPLSILVNNAGIIRVARIRETDIDTFRKVIDVNLIGTFLGLKHGSGSMRKGGRGAIVNFSSVQGIEGREGFAAYSASKFGVRGLSKTAAIEFGPDNIRVNTVFPGPTVTKMIERPGWQKEDYDRMYGKYPLGRMAGPDEIAEVVAFLVSDRASFCTAGEFAADGGVTAGKPRD